MKPNLFFYGKCFMGFVVFFFVFVACGSSPSVSGTNEAIEDSSEGLSLDAAIQEAATRIDGRIEGETKIALLNFNSQSDLFSEYVLDELSANLVDSGKLIVVDRKEIDLIHSEYDFQTSGEVSDSSMQEIGQILGAQSIVSGSLTDIGGPYRLMIRVLDVQSAAVKVQYRTDIANDNRVRALLTGRTSSGRPVVRQDESNTAGSQQAQSDNTRNTSGSSGISSQPNIEAAGLASVPAAAKTGGGTPINYERFTMLRTLDMVHYNNGNGAVVFTPDSKTVIAYYSRYLKLWDVETGKEIRTIRESIRFSRIAISPDGRRFVTNFFSAGSRNEIFLWDFATGAYRESIGHTGTVNSLAFSPDGNYFASGSNDKTIRIWSADSGQEIKTLSEHTGTRVFDIGYVLSVAYSPDGRQIVSCSNDKTIKFWDTSNGKVIRSISANCSIVSYCPDGRKIAAVEGSKIHIFDSQNGRKIFTLTGHSYEIRAISFSPDGSRLLSAAHGSALGSGSNIIVWNMSNGWEVGRLKSEGSASKISSLVISPDGRYFTTGGSETKVTIWGEE